MATNPSKFAKSVLPDAQVASDRTGVPVSVIIAQWGIETAWGTSSLWQQNNYAGITDGHGHFINYPTRAIGLQSYISTISQRAYDAVRGAKSPTAAAAALGQSPWDAGHYQEGGGVPGQSILDAIKSQNLTQYDKSSSGGIVGEIGSAVASASPSGIADKIGSAVVGLVGGNNKAGADVRKATQVVTDPAGAAGDAVSGVASSIIGGLAKPLLTAVFVTAGLALIVAGGWKAVSPTIKPAVDKATDAAATAALA